MKDKGNVHILDIGCANGYGIMSRLTGYEYTSFLGVDKNENEVVKANEQRGIFTYVKFSV